MSGTAIEVIRSPKLADRQNVCVNPSLDDRTMELKAVYLPARQAEPVQAVGELTVSTHPGGFSEEMCKAINCLALPEGVSLKLGALAEPLSVAWH